MPFSEVKKNFGFGCMRLPIKDGNVEFKVAKECRFNLFQGGAEVTHNIGQFKDEINEFVNSLV